MSRTCWLNAGKTGDAEALLVPVLTSRDPEVQWRLADVLRAEARVEEAGAQLGAARVGFEKLLERHLLAFADHATEFYAGSGNDIRRALELARANVANRPTRRAVEQALAMRRKVPEGPRASGSYATRETPPQGPVDGDREA